MRQGVWGWNDIKSHNVSFVKMSKKRFQKNLWSLLDDVTVDIAIFYVQYMCPASKMYEMNSISMPVSVV